MKQLLFLLAVIFFTACSTTKNVVVRTVPPPAPEKPTVATETDSISYAIGVQVATFYKNQGLDTLNYKALQRAFEDL